MCYVLDRTSYLSPETRAALHANYPNIVLTCANSKSGIEKPYMIQTFASWDVAVVGLISDTHKQTLPDISLIPPQNALSALKSDLVENNGIVVVVVHGTQEAAHTLAESFPWIDVLIVAGNQPKDRYGIHSPSIFTGENVIVTNVSQGEAVGVLEMARDAELKRYIFTNAYHGVPEKIAPNKQLGGVLQQHLVPSKVAIGILLFAISTWLVLIRRKRRISHR